MKPQAKVGVIATSVEVWLGEAARHVGGLSFARQGNRQSSAFGYAQDWLGDP